MLTITEKANNRTSRQQRNPTLLKNDHSKKDQKAAPGAVKKIFKRLFSTKASREILEITFWK